ncbi:MAG: sigma-54 dependent transcriptional regulator [Bacteroidia bacterium]|nr:sigma-54 dependent transcriptional regulator [Bacteroidia bacterium]
MDKNNQTLRIFMVEDDAVYSRMLKYILELNPDHEIFEFKTGKDCINNLHQKPDVITLDYSLTDMTGAEVLKKVKNFDPDINVIILSGQTDISTAVNLLKEGAYDYITKDNDTKTRLINTLHNIRAKNELKIEIDSLKAELVKSYDFQTGIIGNSDPMKAVFRLMEKSVKTDITVSIYGETGTGKEVVAKAIHYNSMRKKEPFVAINVTAIPRELIESELFGHEKGSFTGAVARKIGRFEAAGKGTIFLDEIGEMTLDMQAKLLRVLQEKEMTRVGGNELVPLKARIIVATHRNLLEEVEKGNFRQDLYYRLLGLPIHLPPLRSRNNDIVLLAKHFLDDFSRQNKLPKFHLEKDAIDTLLRYHYPGNVRELKAVMDLAAVMCSGQNISSHDIQFTRSSKASEIMMEELTMREYEIKILKHFLDKYNHNILQVARKLDIGKSTIYRLMKEYHIE